MFMAMFAKGACDIYPAALNRDVFAIVVYRTRVVAARKSLRHAQIV